MPERYRAHDVPVAGGTLRVGEWTGDGATVVLLHGLTGSHVSWLFVAEALPGRSLLAPDLRGRGRSGDLPGPYGLATHADDAAAVIRAHADGPVVVVGHSMGGFVAAVLADRHPGLVSAVVLVDGGLPFAPEELEHTEAVVSTIRDGLSLTFPDRVAYLDSYRVHPAFARDWTSEVEAYLDFTTWSADHRSFAAAPTLTPWWPTRPTSSPPTSRPPWPASTCRCGSYTRLAAS